MQVKLLRVIQERDITRVGGENYINFFVNKFSLGRNISINVDAMSLLKDYYFPGNIRELENIIERMVLLSPKDEIRIDCLHKEVYGGNVKDDSIIYFPPQGIDLEKVEKALIYRMQKVVVGIQNETEIEIVSGLKEGDTVYIRAASTSTTSTNSNNAFGGGIPGMGGIGGGNNKRQTN